MVTGNAERSVDGLPSKLLVQLNAVQLWSSDPFGELHFALAPARYGYDELDSTFLMTGKLFHCDDDSLQQHHNNFSTLAELVGLKTACRSNF